MLQCAVPVAAAHVACVASVQVLEEGGGGGGGGGGGSAGGFFVSGESLVFDYLPLWLDLDQEAGPSSGETTLFLQVVTLKPEP